MALLTLLTIASSIALSVWRASHSKAETIHAFICFLKNFFRIKNNTGLNSRNKKLVIAYTLLEIE